MKLPEDFSFSQANLQDFADCEFRFYLRYIRKLEWPAVESEPVRLHEEKMELGYQFHRMVQQYFSGIEPGILQESITDPDLAFWWESFLTMQLKDQPGLSYAEKLLSVPFHGYRLLAKYDLLILEETGKATIYDWKTSQLKPNRITLHNKIQSRVYPMVLFLLGKEPHHFSVQTPDAIDMTYWFPQFPYDPVQFTYSQDQFEEDTRLLTGMVESILSKTEDRFQKTEDDRKCAYCCYRSLCERGISAGLATLEEPEISPQDLEDLSFDAL